MLEVGDVVVVPLANGRCGALCVVEVDEYTKSTQFFVIDGFWDTMPPPSAVARPRPMGHPYSAQLPGRDNVWKGWFRGAVPKDFVVIRQIRLPASLQRHASAEGTMIFQNAEQFRAMWYEHWRSIHDREALQAERTAAIARYEREQARRAAERKATNSLPKMLRERPFAHWREHWGTRAVRAVQAAFHTATKELIALGPDAARRTKEAVFRQLMVELDAIYDREGCIETGEAEELVARIEELAGLVGLRNTNERLTGQRSW
jgi:hypothetical protein